MKKINSILAKTRAAIKVLFYLYIIYSLFWSFNGEGFDTPKINLSHRQAMGLVHKVWA